MLKGSDTTSTAMASTLFYLSKNTAAYARLSNELRSRFKKPSDIVPGPALTQCTYLRACIDEALRMSPPAGRPLWREVQLGGATIDGQYIPAGYDVGVGVYSVHHNPAYYCDPTVYKPERWIKPESESEQLVQARAAYMPFSIGTRGCIGKSLALVELTLALANLVWRFDIKGEESDTRKEFLLKDHVTGAKKGPVLEFSRRTTDKLGSK
jgi:cytochrome P450